MFIGKKEREKIISHISDNYAIYYKFKEKKNGALILTQEGMKKRMVSVVPHQVCDEGPIKWCRQHRGHQSMQHHLPQ